MGFPVPDSPKGGYLEHRCVVGVREGGELAEVGDAEGLGQVLLACLFELADGALLGLKGPIGFSPRPR